MPEFGNRMPDKKGPADELSRQHLGATNSNWRNNIFSDARERKAEIAQLLLLAVAYGMESKEKSPGSSEGNRPVEASDAGNLFESDLFAEDLLKKSPEFLLERAHVTDWAGRTFKGRITAVHPEGEGITAFQYAVWAKDFKMIEMMIKCLNEAKIEEEERERIRTALLGQYEQVTLPRFQGGGLTYTLTYERPNLDAQGIPKKDASGNWDCETVTIKRDENHFDLTPLIEAYEDYERNYNTRSMRERDACWIKLIGTCQRLLPVHILQRYCDPNTPFYPVVMGKAFDGAFKRSTVFYNCATQSNASLFATSTSLSSNFALTCALGDRSHATFAAYGILIAGNTTTGASPPLARMGLATVRQFVDVSTSEIEKITSLLSEPRHFAGSRPS